MLRTIRSIIVALVVVLVAVAAASASAAPTTWQSVDVTLQTEEQQSMMLVSGQLPPNAKLPYEADLAVPAGTELQWIGEILGGDTSKDPELKYVKSTAKGMDVYRFTLTKARIAQIEGKVQNQGAFDGTSYNSALKWTAWQAIPEVRISQRVPQSAQIAQPAPGATIQPAGSGYSYYTKTVKSPKAGDVLDLTFSYTLPTGAASTAASAPGLSSSTTPLMIILAVFVGGLGFVAYKVQHKISAARAADDEEPQPAPRKPRTTTKSSAAAASRKERTQLEEDEPSPTRKAKPAVLILTVVGILIAVVVIAGVKGTSAKVVGGKITKSFGAASPCTNASIPVTANPGVDLASQGGKLLDSFIGQTGVGDVTLDIASSTVDISFCASSQSEDSVRQTLAGSGLVSVASAPVAAAPATATVDPSGKTQTASVNTASGIFSPARITLKAGVPAELAFSKSSGCISEVVFSELGLKQDLTAGPATVKLPALEPGTYKFACQMGHQEGQVVVQ